MVMVLDTVGLAVRLQAVLSKSWRATTRAGRPNVFPGFYGPSCPLSAPADLYLRVPSWPKRFFTRTLQTLVGLFTPDISSLTNLEGQTVFAEVQYGSGIVSNPPANN